MGAIQKITDRFAIKVQPDREESTINHCLCGSSEFWLPIKTLIPKCLVCSPPPSEHMHAMDVVADDHGGWWQVVVSGEMESLVKLDRNFKPVYEFR